jgi:hypothetical protein
MGLLFMVLPMAPGKVVTMYYALTDAERKIRKERERKHKRELRQEKLSNIAVGLFAVLPFIIVLVLLTLACSHAALIVQLSH